MALTLIVDEEAGDRLAAAFAEALPGNVVRLPTFAVPAGGLTNADHWRLCVSPDLGSRIRLQGWRDGLIFAATKEQFARRRILLGPRDVLLFHDVSRERLMAAVRLAVVGMTVFPREIMPRNRMSMPVLAGFDELSVQDRVVLAQLARGFSNQQIAARLGQSLQRVRECVNRIFRKLGCTNRTEVAVLVHGRFSAFLELPPALPPPLRPQPLG